MDRVDAIVHYESIREDLNDLIVRFNKIQYDRNVIERDRSKKTSKMFYDLYLRLYEDQAIMEKTRKDKLERGEGEQGTLFDVTDGTTDEGESASEATDTDGEE